jgi:hypothetical protein
MPLTRLKLSAIATGGITTSELLDGTVATADIANNAVTTAKILDANVTTVKILDANVTSGKLESNIVLTGTDAVTVPKGSVAQRGGGVAGKFRYNTDVNKFEGHNGSSWGTVGGGATGGGSDEIFMENGQTITTAYTMSATKNAITAGPISINSGITVTVPSGARWVVI